jgi:redox-sensitive bicupin YhaK (pirin superfamily)
MIAVRPARDRLHTRIGWLDSRHSFTFDEHIDPRHMGFRALRVINEDRITPGHGFGMRPRRDMEILTFVLAGALRHEDSLGTASILRPGDVQRITAGTGVLHSEFNASDREPLHMLEVWLTPGRPRLPPSYERRTIPGGDRPDRLALIGSHDGRDGSLTIHQDVAIYSAVLGPRRAITHPLACGRHAWIQVVRGAVQLKGAALRAGDGAALSDEPGVEWCALTHSETLLFDVA